MTPKSNTVSPIISEMGKEAFEFLAVKEKFFLAAFKPAFAKVAHKHKIYHRRDRAQYNYHFQQVMGEVKCLIIEHNKQKKKTKTSSVTLSSPPQQQGIVVPIPPRRSKYDRTLELF